MEILKHRYIIMYNQSDIHTMGELSFRVFFGCEFDNGGVMMHNQTDVCLIVHSRMRVPARAGRHRLSLSVCLSVFRNH